MKWRKAVNEMCFQCIYDPYSGNGTKWQQVTACQSTKCPLYEVRPISKPKKEPTGNPIPENFRRENVRHREDGTCDHDSLCDND